MEMLVDQARNDSLSGCIDYRVCFNGLRRYFDYLFVTNSNVRIYQFTSWQHHSSVQDREITFLHV
ncbi:hypothetical protein ASC75_24305 [Aminobacter sp. DSM 101952]|nr:hypothetical protein ASC75_24305 [Aminobacter sp. DSM 101952]